MNFDALFASTHMFWDWSYLWTIFGMPVVIPIEGGAPDMCALAHGVTCTNELNPNPPMLP